MAYVDSRVDAEGAALRLRACGPALRMNERGTGNGERGKQRAESRKQKAESRKQKAESRKHRGGLLPFALNAAKRSRRAARRDAASSKRLHVTHENKSRLQAGSC